MIVYMTVVEIVEFFLSITVDFPLTFRVYESNDFKPLNARCIVYVRSAKIFIWN